MKAIYLLVFSLIGCLTKLSVAQTDLAKAWEQAQKEVHLGQYPAATQALFQSPLDHPDYFYNLGTLFALQGQLPLALAYLERAAQDHSLDPQIQYQIRAVEERLHLPARQLSFLDRLSLDEIRSFLGILSLLFLVSAGRSLLKTRQLLHPFRQPAPLLLLLACLFSFSFYQFERWSNEHPLAIPLQTILLRSGPGEHFSSLQTLQAGSRVRLLKTASQEGWRQVREIRSSQRGWVQESSLLQVSDIRATQSHTDLPPHWKSSHLEGEKS